MYTVQILTSSLALGEIVAAHLSSRGFSCSVTVNAAIHRVVVRRRRSVPSDAANALAEAISPFDLVADADEANGSDFEVELGSTRLLPEHNLRVRTDNPALAATLHAVFGQIQGGPPASSCLPRVEQSMIRYGGADPFARQLLRFVAKQHGVECLSESKEWPDHDMDLYLDLHDQAFAGRPAKARYGVRIETDAADQVEPLRERLEASGYRVTVSELQGGAHETFAIAHRGWLTAPVECAELDHAVREYLTSAQVNLIRFPLKPIDSANSANPIFGLGEQVSEIGVDALDLRLRLPIGRYRAGTLRPYGDDAADTWNIQVVTDDASRIQPLLSRLRGIGFAHLTVLVEEAPLTPWRVSSDTLEKSMPRLAESLYEAVRDEGASIAGRAIDVERRTWSSDRKTVRLTCMTEGLANGDRDRRVAQSQAHWKVSLCGGNKHVEDALKQAGFTVSSNPRGPQRTLNRSEIHHGGAPDVILDKLRAVVRPFLVHNAPAAVAKNVWDDQDRDCYVFLPRDLIQSTVGSATVREAPNLSAFVHAGVVAGREVHDFIRVEEDRVFVADVELVRHPRSSPRTPPESAHRAFAIDASTAELLRSLALALRIGEPAALEGVSGASKTSSITFLAALTRTPMWRVNLSGYSEPSELLGTHIPDARGGATFRWKDGPVIEAATMKGGAILLLDEANLAGPATMEILNPLLEHERSLVHPESGREVEIDPGLRIFATGNAGYAGRVVQSPAWRNRLRAWHLVEAPAEEDLRTYLRASVLGETSIVTLAGKRWRCPAPVTPWRALAGAPGIERFLDALARFHSSLAHALAVGKDKTAIVTRRDLASVLDFLLSAGGDSPERSVGTSAYREALARYYLAPRPRTTRNEVLELMDAAGIGPQTWLPEGA